jgi:dTDP-4-dehydrorhamnose reductase
MKVLVIGGTGMLGHKLVQTLGGRFEVWATVRSPFAEVEHYNIFDRARTIDGLDVTKTAELEDAIGLAGPDVIINAVGVVKQLPGAADVVRTLTINSIVPHRLAEIAARAGSRLILISTDCVFDGKTGGYSEDDTPDALDLYGQSKHFGEVTTGNCLTLRTSIIGRELYGGHGLVEWFLSNRQGSVRGFANAVFSGFPTIVFADIIANLITDHAALRGLFHVSSEPINKFDLLKLVNEAYGARVTIERDDDFHMDRSLDSNRFRRATGFAPPAWPEMIGRMAADKTPYDEIRDR